MIRRVVSANAILLLQHAVGSLVPLLLLPHIVRSIGLAEYGHLAVALAWGAYGAVIVQYAFQLTGPRRVAQISSGETPGTIFAEIFSAKLMLLLGVLLLALIMGLIFANHSSTWAERIPVLSLPIAASLNSTWFLQSQGRFAWVCTAAVIGSATTLAFGFSFVTDGDVHSKTMAAVAIVMGPLIIGGTTLVFAVQSIFYRDIHWQSIRPSNALKEGLPLFGSQFVSAIYMLSGPIVIEFFIGAQAAGAYSAVERLINAIVSASLLTHVAAYPSLAAAYSKDRNNYWRMMRFVLTGYLAVTGIIVVIAWTLRDSIVSFLLGSTAEGHSALIAWGLAWMMLSVFGTALTGYLTVSGRSDIVMSLTLKILTSAVALGVPAVLFFGSAGWMAAMVLSQFQVLHTGYRFWRIEHVA